MSSYIRKLESGPFEVGLLPSVEGLPRCMMVLLVVFCFVPNALAQQIRLESQVEVSAAEGGWYPWYEIHADPTNPANLIVCGSVGSGKQNTLHGFVYSSSDSGRTWHLTLEDKNSSWVSEQSCAFGVAGRAYFVSEATKVIDGARHTDVGTTRIFVSDDSGRSWIERAKTRWADYSSSVVDTRPGPWQNRLYTFFNMPIVESGDGHRGTRVALLELGSDASDVVGPFFDRNMNSDGSFPEQTIALKNGQLLTLYWGGVKTGKGQEVFLGAIHVDEKSNTLPEPVIITHTPTNAKDPCYGYAGAYDPWHEEVFASYHEFSAGRCRFMLTSSVDGGQTWSPSKEIVTRDGIAHNFESPAMAANRDGVLGLMWRDRRESDCWHFAVSLHPGELFSSSQPLSQCPASELVGSTLSTAFLVSEIAGSKVRVANMRGEVWRNSGSLTATADGAFHPVWGEAGNGEGQLRTAVVVVGGLGERQLPPLPMEEKDARDISQDVAVLYGGDQHFDISSGTLTVDIVLKNKSKGPIRAPLLLKALTLSTEFERLEIANASNGASGPGAIWDLSKALPNGVLEPGAATEPYSLVFRVSRDNVPPRETEVVSAELKVLACAVCEKSR